MSEKSNRERILLKLWRFGGVSCFIAAAVFIVIGVAMRFESVYDRYSQYLVALVELENKVAALQTRWLIIIVIFLLYLLRSLSMIYPYTIVYIISAMVFPPVESFIINMLGMAMTFALRYYTGIVMGEGYWNKVLKRHPTVNSVFETRGKGSPLLLFALRLVPFCPLNTLSHLYGTFEYPFLQYMLLSCIAITPRMITYSFIGYSVYDPLSSNFIIPMTVLLIFSGCASFFLLGVTGLTVKVNHLTRKQSAALPAEEAPAEPTQSNA